MQLYETTLYFMDLPYFIKLFYDAKMAAKNINNLRGLYIVLNYMSLCLDKLIYRQIM